MIKTHPNLTYRTSGVAHLRLDDAQHQQRPLSTPSASVPKRITRRENVSVALFTRCSPRRRAGKREEGGDDFFTMFIIIEIPLTIVPHSTPVSF